MISATGLREIRNELFWRTIYLRKIQRIGVLITASAPDRSLKATDFAVIILCSLRLLALALLLLRCVKSRRKKKMLYNYKYRVYIHCLFSLQAKSQQHICRYWRTNTVARHTHTHAVRERETVPVSVFKYEYGLWLPCAVYRLVADETI